MSQCKAPVPIRLLRKVDTSFVEQLKKRMLEDPAAPGLSPLALCVTRRKEIWYLRSILLVHYKFNIITYVYYNLLFVLIYTDQGSL